MKLILKIALGMLLGVFLVIAIPCCLLTAIPVYQEINQRADQAMLEATQPAEPEENIEALPAEQPQKEQPAPVEILPTQGSINQHQSPLNALAYPRAEKKFVRCPDCEGEKRRRPKFSDGAYSTRGRAKDGKIPCPECDATGKREFRS